MTSSLYKIIGISENLTLRQEASNIENLLRLAAVHREGFHSFGPLFSAQKRLDSPIDPIVILLLKSCGLENPEVKIPQVISLLHQQPQTLEIELKTLLGDGNPVISHLIELGKTQSGALRVRPEIAEGGLRTAVTNLTSRIVTLFSTRTEPQWRPAEYEPELFKQALSRLSIKDAQTILQAQENVSVIKNDTLSVEEQLTILNKHFADLTRLNSEIDALERSIRISENDVVSAKQKSLDAQALVAARSHRVLTTDEENCTALSDAIMTRERCVSALASARLRLEGLSTRKGDVEKRLDAFTTLNSKADLTDEEKNVLKIKLDSQVNEARGLLASVLTPLLGPDTEEFCREFIGVSDKVGSPENVLRKTQAFRLKIVDAKYEEFSREIPILGNDVEQYGKFFQYACAISHPVVAFAIANIQDPFYEAQVDKALLKGGFEEKERETIRFALKEYSYLHHCCGIYEVFFPSRLNQFVLPKTSSGVDVHA